MPRRISHSYWTLLGTLSQRIMKRLRFSTPSLLLSYYPARYPQGTEPPKLVYRDEEQNKPPPTTEEETETCFSTCTDTNL